VPRTLRAHGRGVLALRHLPRAGMAEQRAYLLAQSEAPYCLFLDDEVIIEPDLLARLLAAIRARAGRRPARPLDRLRRRQQPAPGTARDGGAAPTMSASSTRCQSRK
jgi:hypothetical protein